MISEFGPLARPGGRTGSRSRTRSAILYYATLYNYYIVHTI